MEKVEDKKANNSKSILVGIRTSARRTIVVWQTRVAVGAWVIPE